MATPAFALKPGTHADVAQASCQSAGLPKDLCTRIATEDYDTDEREWNDPSAHAQIDDNQTACAAADQSAARVWQLGADLRTQLAAFALASDDEQAGAIASSIGRALHTVQDDCAHHGMPNPQHAWFSLGDFCDGTATGPDVQDDAISCARTESTALMRTAADAIQRAGVAARLGALACPGLVCHGRYLPGPFDACEFLSRASDWDGIDRTWNDGVVAPALRAAFAAGLAGHTAPSAMCHGDERVLSNAVSEPTVDVSGGAPSCVKAHVLCLGKADDAENPFADDPAPAADAGCNAAHGDTGLAMLALVGLVSLRRRRR
ncbi:MAG TPA: MYXO-CTERM sorting domain-containing protein [Kofleriaceae bacterium]|nr:MYXO-CTERM sorting domain-containing protein [Kofleriaceae bacterium]